MALAKAIVDGLSGILGAASVLTKPEDVIPYGFDGTAGVAVDCAFHLSTDGKGELDEGAGFAIERTR